MAVGPHNMIEQLTTDIQEITVYPPSTKQCQTPQTPVYQVNTADLGNISNVFHRPYEVHQSTFHQPTMHAPTSVIYEPTALLHTVSCYSDLTTVKNIPLSFIQIL